MKTAENWPSGSEEKSFKSMDESIMVERRMDHRQLVTRIAHPETLNKILQNNKRPMGNDSLI